LIEIEEEDNMIIDVDGDLVIKNLFFNYLNSEK
jgi:hypothetical protein